MKGNAATTGNHFQCIAQCDGQEKRGNFVKTILSTAKYTQPEVDFGRRKTDQSAEVVNFV